MQVTLSSPASPWWCAEGFSLFIAVEIPCKFSVAGLSSGLTEVSSKLLCKLLSCFLQHRFQMSLPQNAYKVVTQIKVWASASAGSWSGYKEQVHMHFVYIQLLVLVWGTICALIFVGFNVHGFRRLAVICESFICVNLDIDWYAQNNGQHPQIWIIRKM